VGRWGCDSDGTTNRQNRPNTSCRILTKTEEYNSFHVAGSSRLAVAVVPEVLTRFGPLELVGILGSPEKLTVPNRVEETKGNKNFDLAVLLGPVLVAVVIFSSTTIPAGDGGRWGYGRRRRRRHELYQCMASSPSLGMHSHTVA